MLRLGGKKMQVSVNALIEGSFMFLQGCYLYWALIPGRVARIISLTVETRLDSSLRKVFWMRKVSPGLS